MSDTGDCNVLTFELLAALSEIAYSMRFDALLLPGFCFSRELCGVRANHRCVNYIVGGSCLCGIKVSLIEMSITYP